MEALLKEQDKLTSSANLSPTVEAIDDIIEKLQRARDAIAEGMQKRSKLDMIADPSRTSKGRREPYDPATIRQSIL